jgi:hypothetical protein
MTHVNDEKISAAVAAYLTEYHPNMTDAQRANAVAAVLELQGEGLRSNPALISLGIAPDLIAADVAKAVATDPRLVAVAPKPETIVVNEDVRRAANGQAPMSASEKLTRLRALRAMSPDDLINEAAAVGIHAQEREGAPSAPVDPTAELIAKTIEATGATSGVDKRKIADSVRHGETHKQQRATHLARLDAQAASGVELSASERLTAARLRAGRA